MGLLVLFACAAFFLPLQNGGEVEQDQQTGRFFEQEISLESLLVVSASAFDTLIEFGPENLSGNLKELVRVQLARGYTPEDIWRLANRELASRGQTTVRPAGRTPASNVFRVVPLTEAQNHARLEPLPLENPHAGYLKVFIPLRNTTPEKVLPTVTLLLSKPSGIATQAEGNLLVADLAGHVEQILDLIAILDAGEEEPVLEEFPVEHAPVTAVAALLERVLAPKDGAVQTGIEIEGRVLALTESNSLLVIAPPSELTWWRETIARFDRPEPSVTREYSPRRFGLSETARLIEETVGKTGLESTRRLWRMVEDRLSGALFITTTPSNHVEIAELLQRLEAASPESALPMRFFPIKNRRVSEVLELARELLEAGAVVGGEGAPVEAAIGDNSQIVPPPVQGVSAPLREQPPAARTHPRPDPVHAEKEDLVLSVDEATNRIVAVGEGRLLDKLGLLIEALDVRHHQVLVETLVVVLSEDQSLDLGVELRGIGSSDETLFQLASLFGLGAPDPRSSTLPAFQGTGFAGVILDPGDFSAAVRALEILNHGRSLTTPKVLVNNNQTATLDSVLQTPFASTNASDTVATTSFGGTFDAGTSILIKPQVTDGDQIVLSYTVSLSTFSGDSVDPTLPPPRQENKLESVVTVPDGHTVAIGGLEIESEIEGSSRVPFLGSLPILGQLFRSDSETTTRSRFFVFIRCSVLRSQSFEDLKYLSRAELDAHGLEQDEPRLEPIVIR